jgi:hypothetical protein
MADLSVSLASSNPEDDELDRRDYSETTTETSEQTDISEHKTNVAIRPPVFQQDLIESRGMEHPGAVMSTRTETINGSAHVGLPPGYMVQHHGQGQADHKLKPGWFALTSHLSHS